MAWSREAQLAWAAGFFDGEGHCGIYTDKRDGSIALRLCVVQSAEDTVTPPDTLIRFQQIVETGSVVMRAAHAGNERWRPSWSWEARNLADQRMVMEIILPYLGEAKTAQIQNALRVRAEYEVRLAAKKSFCKRGHVLERGVRPKNRCPRCYYEHDIPTFNARRRAARRMKAAVL